MGRPQRIYGAVGTYKGGGVGLGQTFAKVFCVMCTALWYTSLIAVIPLLRSCPAAASAAAPRGRKRPGLNPGRAGPRHTAPGSVAGRRGGDGTESVGL